MKIDFNYIKVNIPRSFILRCYDVSEITYKERMKISRKLAEIEQADNKLRFIRSIVENVLLKYPK